MVQTFGQGRAIQGLPFTRKIVDDILVWGSSLPELYERIRIIAARCDTLNIAHSKKKFVIGNEILFAGLLLTEKGVKPCEPEGGSSSKRQSFW